MAVKQKGGDLFLERIGTIDPVENVNVAILIDTNVMLEAASLGDLFREAERPLSTPESSWVSSTLQYRIWRARHTTILLWVIAERGITGGILGKEFFDHLERLSPKPESAGVDGTLYVLTVGWVNVVNEMLRKRGLQIGALTEIDHLAKKGAADQELLKIAQREGLPIITNEGNTVTGYSDKKGSGEVNLRGLCHEGGVAVYSPHEYLQELGVNVDHECVRFIQALEEPVMLAYL